MASIAETLLSRTARDGGVTVSLETGDVAAHTSGFYVGGRVAGYTVPVGATLMDYIGASNRLANAMDGTGYVGTWTDGDLVYVDASDHVEDFETAVKLAASRGELAIWEIAGGTEFRL